MQFCATGPATVPEPWNQIFRAVKISGQPRRISLNCNRVLPILVPDPEAKSPYHPQPQCLKALKTPKPTQHPVNVLCRAHEKDHVKTTQKCFRHHPFPELRFAGVRFVVGVWVQGLGSLKQHGRTAIRELGRWSSQL